MSVMSNSAGGFYRLFESFTRVTSTGSHIVIAHSSEPQFSILSATDEVRVERIVR